MSPQPGFPLLDTEILTDFVMLDGEFSAGFNDFNVVTNNVIGASFNPSPADFIITQGLATLPIDTIEVDEGDQIIQFAMEALLGVETLYVQYLGGSPPIVDEDANELSHTTVALVTI